MTDEEIIELFYSRSDGAIDALSAKYKAYCASILRRFLSDDRDVEECLSDVWLSVWRSVPPAKPEHFKGYLAAIARNRAIAKGRENAKQPAAVEDSALELASCLPAGDVHTKLEQQELGEAISRFLHTQRQDVRTVFLRRYWYSNSLEETAAFMGWTVSKTKSALFRTRGKLREFLKKEELL